MVTSEWGEVLDPRNNLEYYTPIALKNAEVWTEKALRAEYTRLRDISVKRLNRMAKSEFRDSEVFVKNQSLYLKLSDIKTTAELRKQLTKAAFFVASKTGSVTGLRRAKSKAVETLNDRGYTFINKANLEQFGRFMDDYRAVGLNKIYDSSGAAALFDTAEAKDLDIQKIEKDFGYWLSNQEELNSINLKKGASVKDYRRELAEIHGKKASKKRRTPKRRNKRK